MFGYLQTFWEQFDWSVLLDALQRILSVLLCLTVHESSHALAAYTLGDSTAKQMKRLNWNPLHHIDWLGLAAMFLCGFGWAKPVPVDMNSFKNPRRGMALTALAGPISNFLLAFGMIFGASLMVDAVSIAGHVSARLWSVLLWTAEFFVSTAVLSIGLGVFNLIPIPPLDGSKVLFSVLPERAYRTLMYYERYGMLILLCMIWLDLGGNYLTQAIQIVYSWMIGLFF